MFGQAGVTCQPALVLGRGQGPFAFDFRQPRLQGFLSAGDFLAGDAITLADIAVISQLNALVWAQEAKERFDASAPIQAWHARVDEIAPA